MSPLQPRGAAAWTRPGDRKSTRLNSSHANISYAVFCLKKKLDRPPWKKRKMLLLAQHRIPRPCPCHYAGKQVLLAYSVSSAPTVHPLAAALACYAPVVA